MVAVGRALRHRNYRLFFTGQGISLIGTWLTKVATAWLVYRLTGSAWLLGVVGFAGQIPTFLLAPLAGVLVDRWNRVRVLLATQTLAMLQSAVLASLALGGVIRVWEILALNVLQGLIDAFDMPVRQSLVVHMVEDRADLPNAIALNSSMVNGARLLGPAIAGVLIAAVGEAWCFFVDALSYGAVILCVLLMRLPLQPRADRPKRVMHEMGEGFRYVMGFAPMRALLLMLAVSGLAGRPFNVLLPVVAREVMQQRGFDPDFPAPVRSAHCRPRRASARSPERSTWRREGASSGWEGSSSRPAPPSASASWRSRERMPRGWPCRCSFSPAQE